MPDERRHYITHFGVVAAARRLEDFADPGRKRIRVVLYRGANKVHTIDDHVTNLIGDAVAEGRIKRKDAGSGKKFAEYVPYWA